MTTLLNDEKYLSIKYNYFLLYNFNAKIKFDLILKSVPFAKFKTP